MFPLVPLFQQTIVQEMFERILYIWAIRHPASGYVQGINDLVTPFFVVFLQEVVPEGEWPDWNVFFVPYISALFLLYIYSICFLYLIFYDIYVML